MCGKSYEIPFVFKGFSKLSNFNLLLTPDPCLTRSLFSVFLKLLGTQIFTSSQGIQVSFDELWRSNGAGGFSVVDMYSVPLCWYLCVVFELYRVVLTRQVL